MRFYVYNTTLLLKYKITLYAPFLLNKYYIVALFILTLVLCLSTLYEFSPPSPEYTALHPRVTIIHFFKKNLPYKILYSLPYTTGYSLKTTKLLLLCIYRVAVCL